MDQLHSKELGALASRVLVYACNMISTAAATASSPTTPPSPSRTAISDKTLQAAVAAAAASALVAATVQSPEFDVSEAFGQLLDIVSACTAISDHPDVAEACACAVRDSTVMQHDAWAAKYSSCLLGLIQVQSSRYSVDFLNLIMPMLCAVRGPRGVCASCRCDSFQSQAIASSRPRQACAGA
jgi:hypothetical protein